jgi:hypothetical protein
MPSKISEGRIDCSTFVFKAAQDAGLQVPWTSAMGIDSKTMNAGHYSSIANTSLQRGDVVVFGGASGRHMAIITQTGLENNFIGSQVSTGVKEVENWTAKPVWSNNVAGYFEVCVRDIPVRQRRGGGGGGGVGGSGGEITVPALWFYGGNSESGTIAFIMREGFIIPGPRRR